nr:neuroblastoma breakpoint family member 6-like protein [Equus asinus]
MCQEATFYYDWPCPNLFAEIQKDQKDEERDKPTAPRELQEEEEMNDACQDSLDEQYLTLASHHDLSESCHPPDSPTIPSDEHEIYSCLDGAHEYSFVKKTSSEWSARKS